jgi:hypothetical protein
MKQKHIVMVALAVATLALAAFAGQEATKRSVSGLNRKVPPSGKSQTFLLKSEGRLIAELKTVAGTAYSLIGPGTAELSLSMGTITATNGVTLTISDGDKSVSVGASEIETLQDDR